MGAAALAAGCASDKLSLTGGGSIVELTDRSVRADSRPIDCPDFTRGIWKTAKPFAVEGIDLSKMGLS